MAEHLLGMVSAMDVIDREGGVHLAADRSWVDDAVVKGERVRRCCLRSNACVPAGEVQQRGGWRKVRTQSNGEKGGMEENVNVKGDLVGRVGGVLRTQCKAPPTLLSIQQANFASICGKKYVLTTRRTDTG